MYAFRLKEMEMYYHNVGHMTKMAAITINDKTALKIFFPGTSEPISIKLGMKHQRLKLIII